MSVKSSRCYTRVEREIFLELLKEYKDIIENKKSDSVTLKQREAAWKKIEESYNTSHLMSQQRTLVQLKKWWANIKQHQREAKTKKRQGRLGTGGGPETNVADIDPNVEVIVPHLMVSAPCQFSSNLSDAKYSTLNLTDSSVQAVETTGDCPVLVNPFADVLPAVTNNDTASKPELTGEGSTISNVEIFTISDQVPLTLNTEITSGPSSSGVEITVQKPAGQEQLVDRPTRRIKTANSTGTSSTSSCKSEARTERIRMITRYEGTLQKEKLEFEQEMMELKKTHLIQMHEMELKAAEEKANKLELRAALARAELAGIELMQAKKSVKWIDFYL